MAAAALLVEQRMSCTQGKNYSVPKLPMGRLDCQGIWAFVAWGNKPSQKGDYEAVSPCIMSDLSQHVLEPILVEEAGKVGARF